MSVIASTVAVKIPPPILHKDFYCDHNNCNYLQYQVIVMKETLVKMEETALSMQEHTAVTVHIHILEAFASKVSHGYLLPVHACMHGSVKSQLHVYKRCCQFIITHPSGFVLT